MPGGLDRSGRPVARQLDLDRVSRGIDQLERGIRTELPLAVDALIEGRPERGVDERPVDAQHAVEIGRSEHRDAPVGHGRLSLGFETDQRRRGDVRLVRAVSPAI